MRDERDVNPSSASTIDTLNWNRNSRCFTPRAAVAAKKEW